MSADLLAGKLNIERVRVTRWRGSQEPENYDRTNPQAHPDCLEIFEIQDGCRSVIFKRAD